MSTKPTADLSALRARLDRIDADLVSALAQRQSVIDEVASAKQGGGQLRDPEREEALLRRLLELGASEGLEPFVVTRVFRELIDHSVRRQQVLLAGDQSTFRRVAYQGGEGAFSHSCAQRHFAAFEGETELVGHGAFRPMLESVRDGVADYAVLPIENSIAGSINESYDLLNELDLHIVGEEAQAVVHCLIALPGAEARDLRRVFSHPVALLQCGRFLAGLEDCRSEAYPDTALAVAKIKADGDKSQGAIASEEAAVIHGLPVLRRGIQDEEENLTRMVIIARQPRAFDPRVPCKTSLVFSTRHTRGSLARCIAVLADHDLNLTKLESRPEPKSPFRYRFYLDFEGNTADLEVQQALDDFRKETSVLRVLGCYPSKMRAPNEG